MGTQDLRSLLDRIRAIQHACDLDLLLFFYRHPRALLTDERLVAVLGYDRGLVAKSLDGLIEAGLLTRSQNLTNTARLYVLQLEGVHGRPLSALLKIASTRQGRMDTMRLLQPAQNHGTSARVRRSPVARVA
jgi:hypothetical protein